MEATPPPELPGGPTVTDVALGRGAAAVALAVAAVVLGVFVVWPLGAVLVAAPSAPVAGVPAALVGSLALALASTVATLAIAAPLAYAVVRGGGVAARRPIAVVACLPLPTPPFTAGLALLVLLGPRAQAAWALVAAQALTFVPLACVLLAARLGALDRDREEVAASLGAGAWTVFARVTLPRAWPALSAAALTTFVASLADLGNPVLVGGQHPVVTREVYERAVSAGDPVGASALALALAVPHVAAWSLGRNRTIPGSWWPAAPGQAASGWRRSPDPPRRLGAAAAGVAAIATAPWLVVVAGSLVHGGGDWSPSLAHWTTVVGSTGGHAIGWSVALALLAGAVGTAGTLALAYLLERGRRGGIGALRALARLPAAVPGVALGLGYVLALGEPPDVAALALLASVASVVVWKLPCALAVAGEALRRIDPAAEAAALGLGASARRTLARVVLPALADAAVAAFGIFFVSGLVTVSTVAFLAGSSFQAAAPTALARAAGGAVGEASALAALVLGLAGLAALALRARAGRAWVAAPWP